ncbi:hypothetical protein ROZALSC1DRAFT_24598, partial [Rozella allomycis CSF55]
LVNFDSLDFHVNNEKRERLSSIQRGELLEYLESVYAAVQSRKEEIELYIYESIEKVPSEESAMMNCFKTINLAASAKITDIYRLVIDKSHLKLMNPYLCNESVDRIQKCSIQFLKLCVLCDKIERIQNGLSDNLSNSILAKDLLCKRIWNAECNPRWLVFEAENEMQIRPIQYLFAQFLIENPFSICQLNMGCGKTRVVLPMLIMHYVENNKVPCVYVMNSLLRENIEYLHLTLTASSQNIQVLEHPFSRQVEMTEDDISIFMDYLSTPNACLISCPEYRMSLMLKPHELKLKGQCQMMTKLQEYIRMNKFVEIFDESDALLSHIYQLIYTVGTQTELTKFFERSVIIQATLQILNSSQRIHDYLSENKLLNFEKTKFDGELYKIRFPVELMAEGLTERETWIKICEMIFYELVGGVFENLEWISVVFKQSNKNFKRMFKEAVFNLNFDPSKFLRKINDEFKESHVLMLRGLFAHEILLFILKRRYQVEYGIDVKRSKRMAVPYKAADIPTEKSEFSHPDVCLGLTILSYYHNGLNKEQLRQAFRLLLSFGSVRQEKLYNAWYDSIKANLDQNEIEMIDKVNKIDPTNALQEDVLHKRFGKCIKVINFWLNYIIFPIDTIQYPQRIAASAWTLTSGDHCIGFSGTNDTSKLLPSNVVQRQPNIQELISTNGLMLNCILNHSKYYSFNIVNLTWKEIVNFCLEKQSNALIDTGSLLAGKSNKELAEYILLQNSFINSDFKGICYFDVNFGTNGQWMVIEKGTNKINTLVDSHIHEKDTFVIFDDARSRGADMKLKDDATAVITLGPKITKDKFMQGAGRMRKLLDNQRLIIISSFEVNVSIKKAISSLNHVPTINDVIQWILLNTEKTVMEGLQMWTSQGLQYAKQMKNPDSIVCNERINLTDLYGLKHFDRSLMDEYLPIADNLPNTKISQSLRNQLVNYGAQVIVSSSGNNEQCERESELEIQEQQIVMREYPTEKAVSEHPWNYRDLLTGKGINVDIYNLYETIGSLFGIPNIEMLGWNKDRIYCTKNFYKSIERKAPIDCFAKYINMILESPS